MTGRLSGPVSVFGVSFSGTLPRSGTLSLFRDDFPLLGYFSFQERCPSDFRSLRLRRCGLRRCGSRFSDACPPPFCGCGACALWACPSRFRGVSPASARPFCISALSGRRPAVAALRGLLRCTPLGGFLFPRGFRVGLHARREASGIGIEDKSGQFLDVFQQRAFVFRAKAIAVPSCPARPVRPMRCT